MSMPRRYHSRCLPVRSGGRGVDRHAAGWRAPRLVLGVLGPDGRLLVDAVLLQHEVGPGGIALCDRLHGEIGQGHTGIRSICFKRRVVPVGDLSGQEKAGGVTGQLERLGKAGNVVHEGHAGRGDRDEFVSKRRRGRADARIHITGVADRVVDRPVGELVTPLTRVTRGVLHGDVVWCLPHLVGPVRHRRGRERRAGPGDSCRGDERTLAGGRWGGGGRHRRPDAVGGRISAGGSPDRHEREQRRHPDQRSRAPSTSLRSLLGTASVDGLRRRIHRSWLLGSVARMEQSMGQMEVVTMWHLSLATRSQFVCDA